MSSSLVVDTQPLVTWTWFKSLTDAFIGRNLWPRMQSLPVPHRRVIRRIIGAVIGFLGGNSLVVEEDLRPIRPRRRHGIGEIRHHLLRVGPTVLRAQGVEMVRVVDGGPLHLSRLVVLVDDVALVIDRLEV